MLLKLQVENRFPSIWTPSTELRDLRALLMHRHQWVRMRTRVQNTLQAIALSRGLRRGKALWTEQANTALKEDGYDQDVITRARRQGSDVRELASRVNRCVTFQSSRHYFLLLRKVHAAKKVGEARVLANRIQAQISL